MRGATPTPILIAEARKVDEIAAEYILAVLQRRNGNQTRAAANMLGAPLSSTESCGIVTQAALSGQSQTCIGCHKATSPGIVGQWKVSAHEKSHVGCFECHQAAKGDRDGFEHNGFLIATIVSPTDCSRCHEREYQEFEASHHSEAAKTAQA